MGRKTAIALGFALSAVGTAALWPHLIVRILRFVFPNIIWRIDTSERVVALTFDDGPDPIFTPQVLGVLRQHGVKATFFLVGERVRRFPEVVELIRKDGHGIGNHSDSWRRTPFLSDREFTEDLLRAEQTLGIQESLKFFRPAGGLVRPQQMRALKEHGYTVVLGSAYAWDPYRTPSALVWWLIGRGVRPGAIIVLHDSGGNRSKTVAALPGIIKKAHARGFRFERLEELVRENIETADASLRSA